MTSAYDQLIAALPLAWGRVADGTDMAGTDGVTPWQFEARLDAELDALADELRRRTYAPRPLLRFYIPKASGGERMIQLPAVRDRVAQAAALHVLGPTLDRELEHTSFAYRRGRSWQDAVARIEALREAGYTHVAEADIDDFFDTIDHDLLVERLAEVVPDDDVLRLVRQWVASDAVDVREQRRMQRTQGVPQGALISPLLSNLFLDRFDEAMTTAGYQLVRYADDFVLLARSEDAATDALELTEAVLARLKLRLEPSKTAQTSFDDGFTFLGHLFVRGLALPTKKRGTKALPPAPPEAQPVPLAREGDTQDSGTQESPSTEEGGATPSGSRVGAEVAAGLAARTLDETALGRAFLKALDSEGLSVGDFLTALGPGAGTDADGPVPPPNVAVPSVAELQAADDLDDGGFAGLPLAPGTVPFRRTLYVQEQGAWVRMQRGHFVVTARRDPATELLRVPAVKIDQLVLFGTILLTPATTRYCLKRGLPVTYLSSRGAYYGQLRSTQHADVARVRQQMLRSLDPDYRLGMAKRLVRGRLQNARNLLRRRARALRNHPGAKQKGTPQGAKQHNPAPPGTEKRAATRRAKALEDAIAQLSKRLRRLPRAETLDELRGLEGDATATYFRAYGVLFEPTGFAFPRRSRRPPLDPVNAMLSLGYSLLYQNLFGFVQLHRLSPYVGCLHTERPGHPALVSDLVEEFRFLIERMVLTLCARRIIKPGQFTRPDDGPGCFLDDDARAVFLRRFEDLMLQQVRHPGTGRTVDYRRCLDLQVRAYAAHLEGRDVYTPFVIS